jgi:S-adenosylmethionine-diacylglycerol 3-amino-3-carboxypropyl transferase
MRMETTPRSLGNRVHDGLFRLLCGRSLLYNACWEDPAVDRKALALRPWDSVAVISSAGCNVLDYALDAPRVIWAVDCNPAQTALLELKMAGIRHLDFEDFFSIFGDGGTPRFRALYHRFLRADLSASARSYWDSRLHWFEGRGWRDSFYWRGLAGLFARLVQTYIRLRPGLGAALRELFAAPDLPTQQRIYDLRVEPQLWVPGIAWFLRRRTTMCLLGIPSSQREEIRRDGNDLPGYIRAVLRRVFHAIPARTNYFWAVYARGRYTEDCCPSYLERASFLRLQRGLVNRIRPRTCTLTEFLRSTRESVSRFVLLDHMDWLGRSDPAALEAEWEAILARATPDARILFRSAARNPDYLRPLRVRRPGGPPERLLDRLVFDVPRAEALSSEDRVGTYASFHIAYPVRRPVPAVPRPGRKSAAILP